MVIRDSGYKQNNLDVNLISYGLTPSGFTSQELVIEEERTQKEIAKYSEWLLAIRAYSIRGKINEQDSRIELEALGFQIVREFDDLLYVVNPPKGWTKNTSGYWTTILDQNGTEIISQFFKGAVYDRDAFLNIIGSD